MIFIVENIPQHHCQSHNVLSLEESKSEILLHGYFDAEFRINTTCNNLVFIKSHNLCLCVAGDMLLFCGLSVPRGRGCYKPYHHGSMLFYHRTGLNIMCMCVP